jgi:hypothetical protein
VCLDLPELREGSDLSRPGIIVGYRFAPAVLVGTAVAVAVPVVLAPPPVAEEVECRR